MKEPTLAALPLLGSFLSDLFFAVLADDLSDELFSIPDMIAPGLTLAPKLDVPSPTVKLKLAIPFITPTPNVAVRPNPL